MFNTLVIHSPPAPRLRLLWVGGVSFPFKRWVSYLTNTTEFQITPLQIEPVFVALKNPPLSIHQGNFNLHHCSLHRNCCHNYYRSCCRNLPFRSKLLYRQYQWTNWQYLVWRWLTFRGLGIAGIAPLSNQGQTPKGSMNWWIPRTLSVCILVEALIYPYVSFWGPSHEYV